MAQRLALALVYTFGSGTPGVQSLCLTALCVVYCNLHLVARPFANKYTHALQVRLHSSCSVGHVISPCRRSHSISFARAPGSV
jgi:hypothetical protein